MLSEYTKYIHLFWCSFILGHIVKLSEKSIDICKTQKCEIHFSNDTFLQIISIYIAVRLRCVQCPLDSYETFLAYSGFFYPTVKSMISLPLWTFVTKKQT